MNFLPQFEISISNAFWFSLLFIATNILILNLYPSHYKKRVLTMPGFKNQFQQIVGILNFFLFQGLIMIVIFIPLKFQWLTFGIGITMFDIGYISYVISLINYATTNPDKPVTKGIYKFSRNPQQLATIIMWIGISFMTSCLFIVVLCLIQLITIYPTFIAQEKFCIEKYGAAYIDYMTETPRYIIKKNF